LDHWDVALKCRRDLDPNEIVRVVQTTVSIFINRIEPIRSNHREQDATLSDFLAQDLTEVQPKRDRIHVHEQ
jgi:hypothetical protein